jgi:hypothetical protein
MKIYPQNMNIIEFKNILYCLLFIAFSVSTAIGNRPSLEQDIADGYLDEYSKIEAAFILSGVTDPDSLKHHLYWYDQLLKKLKSFSYDLEDPVGSARTVFMYLHNEWLKTYALESTTLADIVRSKEYNCVAATILFNIICEDFGWDVQAFETPTHVYTIFKRFRDDLLVENTSKMGFDIMNNLKEYSNYLAQYYPQIRIGLDRRYYGENSQGRKITNTELLGLLAYNRAYLANKTGDFEAAYDYVLLAQQFNRDSRSNINFEIGLYYRWGNALYLRKDYPKAFSVFADGYYRYPDNQDFLNNTFTTFYKSLQNNWHTKIWSETKQLIDEMNALEILKEKDRQYIKKILINWQHYFRAQEDIQSANEVKHYLDKIGN